MEQNLIDMDDVPQNDNSFKQNESSLIDSSVINHQQISTNFQSVASEQNSIVINENQFRNANISAPAVSYYDFFREYMKKPETQNLKNELLRFLNETEKNLKKRTKNEAIKKQFISQINYFIENFENSFQQLFNFSYEREYDNGEAIEGIVVKALYNQLIDFYAPEIEEKLEMNLFIFQFIKLENLECSQNMIIEQHFEHAKSQLQKINDYKTPRDKLIAIINTCKITSNMVYNSKSGNKNPTGADEFLPILIYLIIKAFPKKSKTNIQFIDEFRSPKRLKGLEEYYFTSFKSAIEFIESLDCSKLNIQSEEYERHYQENYKGYQEYVIKEREKLAKSNNIQQLQKQLTIEQTRSDKYKEKLNNLAPKLKQLKYIIQQQQALKTVNQPVQELKMNQMNDLLIELKTLQNTISELSSQIESAEKVMNEDQQIQNKRLFGLF